MRKSELRQIIKEVIKEESGYADKPLKFKKELEKLTKFDVEVQDVIFDWGNFIFHFDSREFDFEFELVWYDNMPNKIVVEFADSGKEVELPLDAKKVYAFLKKQK